MGAFPQSTFPNADYDPAIVTQNPRDTTVAVPISLDLLAPFLRVRSWSDVFAAGVTVPETPVNEDCYLLLGPCEVGPAGKR